METTEKLKLLDSFLGSHSKAGNEYLYFCPFCSHHKKKLSINILKGKFKCWVCDISGNLRKLVRKKAPYSIFQQWKLLDGEVDLSTNLEDLFSSHPDSVEEILPFPEKFVTLTGKVHPVTHTKPLNYLKSRGITEEDLLFWKVGFCFDGEYKNRIIFPSFNMNGDLTYFVGRNYTGDSFAKYKAPPIGKDVIFNELYLDFDNDITIVEGIFDAIKAGQNSIPLMGSTLREDSKLFQKIARLETPIYLALDPDASKKENTIARSLINYGIEAYKVNVSPFKDVGEMSKEEFLKRKEDAKLITHDTILQQELGA
jgi:DNA primase